MAQVPTDETRELADGRWHNCSNRHPSALQEELEMLLHSWQLAVPRTRPESQ